MSDGTKKNTNAFWKALGILFGLWILLVLPACAGFGWKQGPLGALGLSVFVYFGFGAIAKRRILNSLTEMYGPLRVLPTGSKRVVFEAATPQEIVIILRSTIGKSVTVISRGALLRGDIQPDRIPPHIKGSVPETIGIWFSVLWDRLVQSDRQWTPGRAWLAGSMYPIWRWLNKIGLYRPSL